MGIASMIRQQKEKFQDKRIYNKIISVENDKSRLEEKRLLQGELAKANTQKASVQKDVQNIQQYNQKFTGPTKFQRFGEGLANVINKTKEAKKEAQKSGFFRGIGTNEKSRQKRQDKISAFSGSGSRGIDFGGSRSLDVGGSQRSIFNSGSRSPFSLGGSSQEKKKTQQRRGVTIIVK